MLCWLFCILTNVKTDSLELLDVYVCMGYYVSKGEAIQITYSKDTGVPLLK